MGRSRKYHTDEERKNANRIKSKRHYHSNRESIALRRLERRSSKKAPSLQAAASASSTTTTTELSSDRFSDPVYWVDRAKRQEQQVATLLSNREPQRFLRDLGEDIATGRMGEQEARMRVEEYLNGLSAIRRRVDTSHGHVLNLVGVGDQLSRVCAAYMVIDAVQRPLEEFTVALLLGLPEFTSRFSKGELFAT
ncbi:hypothetical protein CC1G_05878 [Coprinopsis cinerea okayama7|uniref:Uncharacterized protein n=1 Tax=Coprinopsis cinerea (strain Okayama-7 / 130 / ATCC MYA-4618 / FGSC 9003) TaxID=240176 RepID=A8NAC7_COPC7|nr:hypothetical protein CC1G_05878 [Coprinopsis cinerea okayama7\|eukprot:XP_001831779.2 hypothetical protein CC1G_05878 [Coprinopsis cinerea okayama7\